MAAKRSGCLVDDIIIQCGNLAMNFIFGQQNADLKCILFKADSHS